MVHSAVGVNHGVLHEAAVLVDLLLGDLRWRRFRNIRPFFSRRRRSDRRCLRSTRGEVLNAKGGSRRRRGGRLYSFYVSKKWRTAAGFSFLITTRVRATWGS